MDSPASRRATEQIKFAQNLFKFENCHFARDKDMGPLCPARHSEPLGLMSVYKLVSVGGETAADKSGFASQDLS